MSETARILNHFTAEEDFLKKVRATFGSWIPCPDCEGLGGHTQDCGCFSQPGCVHCKGEGVHHIPCPTCQGKGEVWMTNDDVERIWEDRG